MLKKNNKYWLFSLLITSCLFSGCARDKNPSDPRDPYEHFNRRTFAMNKQIDAVFIRPVARTYDAVLPGPVKKGISNFFNNFGEISNFINDVLQLDYYECMTDASRFVINTTIGIGGLFDFASKMGLERNYEDFGLTLAHWGSTNTPYFVIPILGPSTFRDAVGFAINYELLSPWTYIYPIELRYYGLTLKYIDLRAKLLPGDKLVNEAFDPYTFVRDAYLQRRDYLLEEIKHRDESQKDTYVEMSGKTKIHHQHHKITESTIVNS